MKRILTISTLLIGFILNLLLFGCNKVVDPDSPEKLFEKYKGSVVLIASKFYYEIDLKNGETAYYSPSSKDKIYFDKIDVLNNLSFSTGTGFIISNDGKIITNNHVVNNKDENYKIELFDIFVKLKAAIFTNAKFKNDSLSIIYNRLMDYNETFDEYERSILTEEYNRLLNGKAELSNLYDRINRLDIDNSTSRLIITELGIAYNNTHITDFSDLQECVVIKTSEDEKIDLAVIQTKSKKFNQNPSHILNFEDNNPNLKLNNDAKMRNIKKPVKINDDVYMIGFNRGFSLANTKQGIKSQFTGGKISQEYDGERILYTIPTLEGSSGSPIIDKWGNLVAVNFAKLQNSQNFSFGVPVYELKKFYEN